MPKKKSSRHKQTKKMKAKRPRAKSSARPRTAATARRGKPLRSKSRNKVRRRRGAAARVGSIAARNERRAEAAGQSGDNEQLSRAARADSQSVEELADEGQSFEAEVLSGVEDAEDAGREVRTHEVPEDDVPSEYDRDR